MNLPSSPSFPSSFDPAIHLHSEAPEDAYKAANLSADLQELNDHNADTRAQKTEDGIVIQHRAWKLSNAFRSDEDYAIDTPTKTRRQGRQILDTPVPSSPPSIATNMESSPITYPATMPPLPDSPNKRRKLSSERIPLKDIGTNIRRGGFMEEDSDDDENELASRLFHKTPQTTIKTAKAVSTNGAPAPETVIRVDSLFDTDLTTKKAQDDSAYASDAADHDSPRPDFVDESTQLGSQAQSRGSVLKVQTCQGRKVYVGERRRVNLKSFEQLIAERSTHIEGHARKSYYGVDIHNLLDEISQEEIIKSATQRAARSIQPSVEIAQEPSLSGKKNRTLMWTEKYRARKFTDLVGDERTHRGVLRWLKAWDPIVFPGSNKQKQALLKKHKEEEHEDRTHRKILLLTGPPGLGKTTLAHVCARQAGYEVQEINASDERSPAVVKGRIRDMVGTENVRGHDVKTADGKTRKAGRPVCVIVDEVDGVVGGSSGGGEGGFVKALIDLITLDSKNSATSAMGSNSGAPKKKRKGDKFRMLRPLILICNDVYHPALRPLRQGSFAEVVHMRKPDLNMVVSRVHSIFEKEGVPSDLDGVRRLCEATWGVSTKKEGGTGSGTGEGDIRSVMVVGEWVATKLRATAAPGTMSCPRLTRKWIEGNMMGDLGYGGGATRSLGRGGAKEVVERVFQEGAGFPKTNPVTASAAQAALNKTGSVGVAEAAKQRAAARLREMIDASGESDRILSDCFTSYPTQAIQDDTFLSKPNAAYDWLNFHDKLSSQIGSNQDWELAPYMSTSILAFHHLFASTTAAARPTYNDRKDADEDEVKIPFSGPTASYQAFETQKSNTASIISLQSSLSLPLARMYRSPSDIATELLPYTLRLLAPDVKPVVIQSNSSGPSGRNAPTASVRKASEKALVARAVEAMAATGVRFEKSRVEHEGTFNKSSSGGWVYRMEPPLDNIGAFETMKGGNGKDGVRYAVRQVLEMEWRKESMKKGEEIRVAKMKGVGMDEGRRKEIDLAGNAVKRDFFGRVMAETGVLRQVEERNLDGSEKKDEDRRVWVSFHEGFSNAVRKPMTLKELMDGM